MRLIREPHILRERHLFKLRPTRDSAPRMRTSQIKRTASLQAPPNTWQCTQNASLTFSKVAFLRRRKVRISTTKSASLQPSESCVSTRCSRLSDKWELRFYFRWDPRLWGNMTFVFTRPVFSLYFYNQFNSTLKKADDYFSWFNSTPTISSEHWGGLDCVSRHSQRSFLVASKSLIVHSRRPNPDKVKLKIS